MRQLRIAFLTSVSVILLWVGPKAEATISLYGYNFEDTAFSDDAQYEAGEIYYGGFSKWGYSVTGDHNIDLPIALNGSDLYTFIEGVRRDEKYYNYRVEVLFKDNYLYNGSGSDLVLWERGSSAEPMDISPYDPETGQWLAYKTFTPIRIGDLPNSVDVTQGVNAAEVDFSAWGISTTSQIQKIRISTEQWTGTDRTSADLAALGGLHSVVTPEPVSCTLFGLGGLAMIGARRLKRRSL